MMSVVQKIVPHRHECESVLPVGERDAAEAGAARRHSLGEGDAAIVDDQRHIVLSHFPYASQHIFLMALFSRDAYM